MKKPVKIIFSVVLSVAMVLSLALTAYGASSLTSDFAVTVEKGKVFDENGDLMVYKKQTQILCRERPACPRLEKNRKTVLLFCS